MVALSKELRELKSFFILTFELQLHFSAYQSPSSVLLPDLPETGDVWRIVARLRY
jgi:hypothetical protein